MKFLARRRWLAVALLSAMAFALRTVPQWDSVFGGPFVNFQETDAWFHVRVVENLVRHFPSRIPVDPYMGVGPVQAVATGPFYDWVLGGAALAAGMGNPGERLVHEIAAWFPAVLGALIVPVVFLLGEAMFGVAAGLVGAAVVATLPGHFLLVSSLGFTDHHVMESLLSGLFLLALLRALDRPESVWRTVAAGLVLAAYLLTFVGGAFFVGIVVAWAMYDRIRSLWPREEAAFAARPLYGSFLLAAVLVAPSYRLLWMPFSLAILVGGAAAVFVLEQWGAFCGRLARPRTTFFAGLAIAGVGAGAAALMLVPGMGRAIGSVVPFFFPAYFGTSGAVQELQALVPARGALDLLPAWRQFAGAFVLSIVALWLLGETTVKRPAKGASLLFFWGCATFLLSMGQVRMTYYFAVAAALLSGYAVTRILEGDSRAGVRWVVSAALVAAVFVPNVTAAIELGRQPRGVSADWRQALEWLRHSTPEPFGDPAFYYANYGRDFKPPAGAYNVMSWWDYGYWLEAIARRAPVSNPTQAHAREAAGFLLAQSENEALPLLDATRSRYVVVNAELPLLQDGGGVSRGTYPVLFTWDRTKKIDDYFLLALETGGDGLVRTKLLYRPAYYRSMAVRLFVYGAAGVTEPEGAAVARFGKKQGPDGKSYQALTELRRYQTYADAAAAERACRAEGCALVGDNPQLSCVPLEPLTRLRPAFASSSAVLGIGSAARSAVQVYQVTQGGTPAP